MDEFLAIADKAKEHLSEDIELKEKEDNDNLLEWKNAMKEWRRLRDEVKSETCCGNKCDCGPKFVMEL